MVEKLETLDKNNVLAIRRQILALKNKLKECEDSKGGNLPALPPPPAPGKGAHFYQAPLGAKGWVGKGSGIVAVKEGWDFCGSEFTLPRF